MSNHDKERTEIYKDMVEVKVKDATLRMEPVKSRSDLYDREIKIAKDIFVERNKIYKDTFVYLGLQGTIVTLVGDVFRLRNMVLWEQDHGRSHRDQIEDKLIDVINQAVISLMMLRENNFEGK